MAAGSAWFLGTIRVKRGAGLLTHLISSLGPGAAAILASKGLFGLTGGSGQINPQAASQVSPATVTEIANQAQKQNPSIVDTISGFYAQHPTLVKTLGVAALSIIMSRISQRAAPHEPHSSEYAKSRQGVADVQGSHPLAIGLNLANINKLSTGTTTPAGDGFFWVGITRTLRLYVTLSSR